jgi:hypothetical protein
MAGETTFRKRYYVLISNYLSKNKPYFFAGIINVR